MKCERLCARVNRRSAILVAAKASELKGHNEIVPKADGEEAKTGLALGYYGTQNIGH
jgi:hypothetical protein